MLFRNLGKEKMQSLAVIVLNHLGLTNILCLLERNQANLKSNSSLCNNLVTY